MLEGQPHAQSDGSRRHWNALSDGAGSHARRGCGRIDRRQLWEKKQTARPRWVLLLFDALVLCYVSLQPAASAFCQDRYLGLVLTAFTYAIYKPRRPRKAEVVHRT